MHYDDEEDSKDFILRLEVNVYFLSAHYLQVVTHVCIDVIIKKFDSSIGSNEKFISVLNDFLAQGYLYKKSERKRKRQKEMGKIYMPNCFFSPSLYVSYTHFSLSRVSAVLFYCLQPTKSM